MSIAENYRSSLDYREILRILQKSTSLQENFLWQSHSIGKNVIPIHHFEIDFVTREVVIYFDGLHYRIDSELPFYVKLDYRMSVFKVTEFKERRNAIHFTFPKEIKTLELRSEERKLIPYLNEQTVGLKPSLSVSKESSGLELHVRVFDASRSGLGLLISEHNRAFLKNNRILWITALGKSRLKTPILAEVIYINTEFETRAHARKQKELKVGIKLSTTISADLFKSFVE